MKRGVFPLTPINKLGVIILVSSLGIALFKTVWSVYLESFLHNASYVGFLMTLFILFGIASYMVFIPLVERRNKPALFALSLLLFFVSYFLFS